MSVNGARKFKIVHDGDVYLGSYTVQNGIIKVEYDGKTKSVPLGGHDPIVVADLLMADMVKDL